MRAFLLALLLFPMIAAAEPFPVQYTEPSSQAGALARTCVYWCACLKSSACTCTDWKRQVCLESDDGNGGDVRNITFNIPIYEGDLPVTVRYTVTSVNDDGNETTRGAVTGTPATHTFTAP